MADAKPTIVIKKIKKVSGGHHGGAWKVAYADFVTAMMAFFMLLWLLSSTSKEQKEGIAEYFTPTTGLKDSMGIGFKGGVADSKDGIEKSQLSDAGIVVGQSSAGTTSTADDKAPVEGEDESNLFTKGEAELAKALQSNPQFQDVADNISVEQTPEGLKIQLKDSQNKSMFLPGSTELSPLGQKILRLMVPLINKMPNQISVTGHTDSSPTGKAGYSNWELSADRANSARRFLEGNAMGVGRVQKVVGLGDKEPFDAVHPSSEANRRIDIILLRGLHINAKPEDRLAPKSLLSVPYAPGTAGNATVAPASEAVKQATEAPAGQEDAKPETAKTESAKAAAEPAADTAPVKEGEAAKENASEKETSPAP